MHKKRSSGRHDAMRLTLEWLEPRVMLSSYGVKDLGTLGGSTATAAAINAEGNVVGHAELSNGQFHATLWVAGQSPLDIGTLGGSESQAYGINILGQIVGESTNGANVSSPFSWTSGGGMSDLTDADPQFSTLGNIILTARAVSDTGVIVGQTDFNVIDGFETAGSALDLSVPANTFVVFNALTSELLAVSGNTAVGVETDFSH